MKTTPARNVIIEAVKSIIGPFTCLDVIAACRSRCAPAPEPHYIKLLIASWRKRALLKIHTPASPQGPIKYLRDAQFAKAALPCARSLRATIPARMPRRHYVETPPVLSHYEQEWREFRSTIKSPEPPYDPDENYD
jgi:hypothetical protein